MCTDTNEESHKLEGFYPPLPKLIQRSTLIISASDKLYHASVLKLLAAESNSRLQQRTVNT